MRNYLYQLIFYKYIPSTINKNPTISIYESKELKNVTSAWNGFRITYGGSIIATPVGGHRRDEWEVQPCGDINGIPHSVLAHVGQGVVRVVDGTPQIFTLPKLAR